MCDIMGVCRSSIYYKPVEKQVDSNLENLVITTFKESRRNYGAKRIKKALEKQDICVSKMCISGIMKKYNLKISIIKSPINHVVLRLIMRNVKTFLIVILNQINNLK